jgi:hypothetical protein
VLPTVIRPAHHTLERGRRNPSKGDGRLSRTRPGRRHDVGPMRRVSSVTISPVQPSPLPRYHPGHCSTVPDAVGVRGDKTPPHPLLCTIQPPVSRTLVLAYERRPSGNSPHNHPRSHSWAGTGLTTTPGGNKICHDRHHFYNVVHHTATRN